MSYSEAMVESLLASVWDRTYAWGVQSEITPDPDMPKVKYKSPKEATTFWTHLIDVRLAWENGNLTPGERRTLLLYYGLGWNEEEIGRHQSVSHQAISKRLRKGVRCMTDWLNSDYEVERE